MKKTTAKSKRALVQLLNAQQTAKSDQISSNSISQRCKEVQQALATATASHEDLQWMHSQQVSGAESLMNAEIGGVNLAPTLLKASLANSHVAMLALRVWHAFIRGTKKTQTQDFVSGLCDVLQNACLPGCVYLAAFYVCQTYHPRTSTLNESHMLALCDSLLSAMRNDHRLLPPLASLEVALAFAVLCTRPAVRRKFIDVGGVESVTKEALRGLSETIQVDLGVSTEQEQNRQLFAKYVFGGNSYADALAGLLMSPKSVIGQIDIDPEVSDRLLVYGGLKSLDYVQSVPQVLPTLKELMQAVAGLASQMQARLSLFCQQLPFDPIVDLLDADHSAIVRASIDFANFRRTPGKITVVDDIIESCCMVLDVVSMKESALRNEMVSRKVYSRLITLGADMDFPYSRHALNAVFRTAGVPAVQSIIRSQLVQLLRAGLDRREVQIIVDDEVFMEGMIELAKNEDIAAFMTKKDNDVVLRYVLRVLETGPKRLYDMVVHLFMVLLSRIVIEHRARVFGACIGASVISALSAAPWLTPMGQEQLKAIRNALDTDVVIPRSAVPDAWYHPAVPTTATASAWDRIDSPLPLCSLPSCVPAYLSDTEAPPMVSCARCLKAYYCSTNHQRLHYDFHKRVCSAEFEANDDAAPPAVVPVQLNHSELL